MLQVKGILRIFFRSAFVAGLGKAVGVLAVAATGIGLVFTYKSHFSSALYEGKERLVDKVAVVTGAGDGIGHELASMLANRGASVYMVTRNFASCEERRRKIAFYSHNRKIYCIECDLSSMKAVRQLAEELASREEKIDLLVNNAAVKLPKEREVTEDGFETQLAVNFFSPYLLTESLLPSLLRSPESRILFLTCLPSRPDLSKAFDFTDLNCDSNYNGLAAYQRSKDALLLYTGDLHKRFTSENAPITVMAADPGLSFTLLDRHMPHNQNILSRMIFAVINIFALRSPLQGAQTPIFCLASKNHELLAGKCFKDLKEVCVPGNEVNQEDAKRLVMIAQKWTESKSS